MKESFCDNLLNEVEEGLVVIDMFGNIQTFNRRAKEITGVIFKHSKPHPEGKLEKGDLVIIADNRLGYDDGGLTPEDLQRIGVHSKSVNRGDGIVAIGLFDTPQTKGVYKSWHNKASNEQLSLNTEFLSYKVNVEINASNKMITIMVNDAIHSMPYALAIGHMVVLSSKGDLKFYQAKGYTIRKETIQHILSGQSFMPKGDYTEQFDVMGKPLSKIFEYNALVGKIETCLAGEKHYFENEYFEINKRPTLCSLKPITSNNGNSGLLLKIFDVSNIETMIDERNHLIVEMEKNSKNNMDSTHQSNKHAFEGVIGYSNAMQRVKFLISKAALTQSTVLLTGESGTGKSFIAKEIHQQTFPEGDKPFINVNCTAIPVHLFESELFGYSKGAFTGAERSGKQGYFELAENGTLFLDEIGELPLEMQVKLLHVLQSKMFYKVGGIAPVKVNVKIIAATNKDLVSEVRTKKFREDLYYRINGFPIEIPPLRKRKSDLYSLITSIMSRLSKSFGDEKRILSGEALERLLHYDWPGNVRELENVIELAFNMSDGDLIREEDIILSSPYENEHTLKHHIEQTEKNYIVEKLQASNYDVKKVMEVLELSKTTFYDKVKRYEINLKQQ